MNAAARLVHQNVFFRHLAISRFFIRRQMAAVSLIAAILFSALGIIYVTHLNRVVYADCQHALTEHNQLHIQKGKLLLERSTIMMQARTQQIAEEKLNMILPGPASVIIIHE